MYINSDNNCAGTCHKRRIFWMSGVGTRVSAWLWWNALSDFSIILSSIHWNKTYHAIDPYRQFRMNQTQSSVQLLSHRLKSPSHRWNLSLLSAKSWRKKNINLLCFCQPGFIYLSLSCNLFYHLFIILFAWTRGFGTFGQNGNNLLHCADQKVWSLFQVCAGYFQNFKHNQRVAYPSYDQVFCNINVSPLFSYATAAKQFLLLSYA